MRDKDRIARILHKLEIIWNLVPDWRFTQIVTNLFGDWDDRLNFYMEDDDIEKILDRIIEEGIDAL